MRKNKKNRPVRKMFLALFVIIALSFGLSTYLAFQNSPVNEIAFDAYSDFDEYGCINNQQDLTGFKFGFSALNTNGCGSIAIYNVLALAGKTETLPNVVKQMDIYGQNAFGFLGTNPISMVLYLRSKGVDANICFDKKQFDTVASTSNASIICYVGFSGGHYQALHSVNEGTYQFQNPKEEKTMEQMLTDTSSYLVHFLIYTKF